MIRTKTVLILGAGASAHLDFPLAKGLRTRIGEITNGMASGGVTLPDTEGLGSRDFWAKFRDDFLESGQISIDRFLSRCADDPQMLKAGKYAITAALTAWENPSTLRRHAEHRPSEKANYVNWYEDLFQAMAPGVGQKLPMNKLEIITFNYDRSLEHYLSVAAHKSRYFKELVDAQIWAESIVHHVHGSFGKISNQDGSGSYKYELDVTETVTRANGIRVFHEAQGPDDELHELISAANRVHFMGFSFIRENMVRLGWHTSLGMPFARLLENKIAISNTKGIAAERLEKLKAEYGFTTASYSNTPAHEFFDNLPPLDS